MNGQVTFKLETVETRLYGVSVGVVVEITCNKKIYCDMIPAIYWHPSISFVHDAE